MSWATNVFQQVGLDHFSILEHMALNEKSYQSIVGNEHAF